MPYFDDFDPTLVILAKKYCNWFFRVYVPHLTWEDLAQELRIKLIKQEKKYDKKKPYNDWAYVVCVNTLKNLIVKYTSQKRDCRKVFNFDNFDNFSQ